MQCVITQLNEFINFDNAWNIYPFVNKTFEIQKVDNINDFLFKEFEGL